MALGYVQSILAVLGTAAGFASPFAKAHEEKEAARKLLVAQSQAALPAAQEQARRAEFVKAAIVVVTVGVGLWILTRTVSRGGRRRR